MSAAAYLQIDNGEFTITTGEGSASVTLTASTMTAGQRGGFQTETTAATTEDDSTSQKGIKADGTVTIAGGTFILDTVDDAIHSNGDVSITGGAFTIRTGDDGIHGDGEVTIQGGDFTIPYCYEGIEGLSVTIDDGSFTITSTDDGINAAGGTDGSGFGGARAGQDQFSSSSSSFITINGGTVTTNDGSENNPGQMGGGMTGMTGRGATDSPAGTEGQTAPGGAGQGRGGH